MAKLIPLAPVELKKAQQAIAIVPTNGRITLLMRRFFNVLLHYALEDHKKEGPMETYRRPISDILTGANYTSTNLAVFKDTLRRMRGLEVEWNTVTEKGGRRWGISGFIGEAEIIEEGRRLFIEWSYPPKIKARLLDPKLFAELELTVYSRLRSVSSAGLYEICARYKTNKDGLSSPEPWQWWRPRLTGAPDGAEDEPQEYKYFKRDVLLPAIKEINKISDIEITLIEHKIGNRVSEIQFKTTIKAQPVLPLSEKNLVNNELLERIVRFGFSQEEAAKLYVDFDEARVRANVEYVERQLAKRGGKPIKEPAAYFRDALKKGYAKSDEARGALGRSKSAPALELKPEQADPEANRAMAKFESLSPADRARTLERFAETLKGPLQKTYETQGLGSPMIRGSLAGWLTRNG